MVIVAEVRTFEVSVCAHHTVTAEAVFVPAVVTLKSHVPIVRIHVVWVITTFEFA